MMQLLRKIILCSSCILMVSNSLSVKADTTEDLLNVYGLTLGGPVKSDVELQLEQALVELDRANQLKKDTDEYNRFMEQYFQQRQGIIDKTNTAINNNLKEVKTVISNIESDILEADINDLKKLDSSYKLLTRKTDDLINGLSYYQNYYSFKNIDIDFGSIQDRVVEAKVLYADSIDAFRLGDVRGISFIMPIQRNVKYSYGLRVDPITQSKIRFNAGVDYEAPHRTELGALFNGVVVSTGTSNEIGNYIVIQSGENIRYMYCYCDEILGKEGDYVSQYQHIAYTGNSGSMCSFYGVHIAIYINGNSYDVDRVFTTN